MMTPFATAHLEAFIQDAVRSEYQEEFREVCVKAVENDPTLLDSGLTWWIIYDTNKAQ